MTVSAMPRSDVSVRRSAMGCGCVVKTCTTVTMTVPTCAMKVEAARVVAVVARSVVAM